MGAFGSGRSGSRSTDLAGLEEPLRAVAEALLLPPRQFPTRGGHALVPANVRELSDDLVHSRLLLLLLLSERTSESRSAGCANSEEERGGKGGGKRSEAAKRSPRSGGRPGLVLPPRGTSSEVKRRPDRSCFLLSTGWLSTGSQAPRERISRG